MVDYASIDDTGGSNEGGILDRMHSAGIKEGGLLQPKRREMKDHGRC